MYIFIYLYINAMHTYGVRLPDIHLSMFNRAHFCLSERVFLQGDTTTKQNIQARYNQPGIIAGHVMCSTTQVCRVRSSSCCYHAYYIQRQAKACFFSAGKKHQTYINIYIWKKYDKTPQIVLPVGLCTAPCMHTASHRFTCLFLSVLLSHGRLQTDLTPKNATSAIYY